MKDPTFFSNSSFRRRSIFQNIFDIFLLFPLLFLLILSPNFSLSLDMLATQPPTQPPTQLPTRTSTASTGNGAKVARYYSHLLATKFGDAKGILDEARLTRLIDSLPLPFTSSSSSSSNGVTNPGSPGSVDMAPLSTSSSILDSPREADLSSLYACIKQYPDFLQSNCSSTTSPCLKAAELMSLTRGFTNMINVVDAASLQALAPTILYQMASGACGTSASASEGGHDPNHARKVPLEKSIGYGLLFVTVISLCSLGGAVVLPFMQKTFYKRILTWMTGLAVGTLAGSGLLHLMPHTYDMTYENLGNWDFLFKATGIFAGAYLFFVIERILKTLGEMRRRQTSRRRGGGGGSGAGDGDGGETGNGVGVGGKGNVANGVVNGFNGSVNGGGGGGGDAIMANGGVEGAHKPNSGTSTPYDSMQTFGLTPNDQMSVCTASSKAKEDSHGHSHGLEGADGDIAPVAWMIIFGDGLHNFIDGLSIGAAFTESVLAGISISVAVFCEELPHELGDLAILLNSGMKFKQALFYNFLSACSCFLGLCLGIFLGDVTQSGAKWVFALAAGMFLYLALTDMIPELNRQAEEMVDDGASLWTVLLIQHSGVLIGFAIMLVMAIFGSNIDFT